MNNTNTSYTNNPYNPYPPPPPYGGYVPPQAPYPPYPGKVKHPPVAGNGFDAVFMILTLAFSVFAVHAVFFAGFFKLGFTVAYAIWFVLENIYIFSKAKPKFSFYTVLLGVLSLAASGVFTLYNDEVINTALLLFIAFANAMYFVLNTRQNLFHAGEIGSVLDAARFVIVIPFQFISEPFKSVFEGKKQQGAPEQGRRKPKTGQIILGILISVPIAAVLIGLLTNADPAFKGLIGKLFSNLLLSVVKLILGIILFPLLLSPAFAYRYSIVNRNRKPAVKKDRKRFPAAIAITVLSVISLVYIVYLFAQLAYFFSAFRGILPENYSASDYARKGFFELCAICALNALFIMFSMAFVKEESKGSSALLKLFQTFIAVVSLVIAASSFSKMNLYISLYGFTRKRVLTSIFIVILAIVFVALIIRTFAAKFPYMKMIAVCAACVLIAVGYADIDYRITKYNFEQYQRGQLTILDTDGGFMDEMGDSAIDYIYKFATEGKGDIKARAQSKLCELWGRQNVKHYYSFNLPKSETLLSYNRARVRSEAVLKNCNQDYKYDSFFQTFLADMGYDYAHTVGILPEHLHDYCYDYECARDREIE